MKECLLKFQVTEKIPAPSYVYYELDNFYMNHRDFVKSRIYSQLRGETHVNSRNNSQCEGAILIKEIFNDDESKYYSIGGKKLQPNDYANPCGLIAKSFFNDTYKLYAENEGNIQSKNKEIFINETGIANDYDKQYMFKRHVDYLENQWIDVTNGKK